MDLAGPVAIVTGAARGIGFALSEHLLQSFYRVSLVDINEAGGKEAESKLKEKHGSETVTFVQCDVSSKDQFNDAFEKTLKAFGRVDLVINNAGVVDEHDPELTVATNLVGSIYGCELALKYMGKKNGGSGGIVINVSSIVGLLPYPDTPTYVATKHALVGLTRSYGHQVHFERNEVTFAAICPHYIDTEILREAKRLHVYTPATVETMPVEKVSKGVTKILNDKRNGSVLLVLPEGKDEYVEIPEDLTKIPTALI